MSKRNERYLRSEQTKGPKAPQKSLLRRDNKDGSVVPQTKSAKVDGDHGGWPGIQGKEVPVKPRQPVVISMPKKSQKSKQTQKFPTLRRETKKERLVSIKKRLFALKYGYIWERKTFGHISPAKARKHYEKQLLKISFRQWEDFWWNGRNEWKLNIRADYHNRFRLWLKVWRGWRTFITMKRIKNTKMNLAQRKANHSRLAKCIVCWRVYVNERHKKKEFYLTAKEQGKVLVKRQAFSRWKNRLIFKRELFSMDEQALHFWARNLLYKAWECWIFTYNVTLDEKHKFTFAEQLHNRRLASKVFGSFKIYGVQRKLKKLRLRSAERYRRLRSLHCWFITWKTSWTRKVELARFEDTIQCRGEVAKKRRMFLAWKCYINLCHVKRQNEYIAWNHFETSLKSKSLKALQRKVHSRNMKNSRKATAAGFYKTILLRKAWNQWLAKCEDCEELRLLTLNNSVRNHHRKVLLKRMMKSWRIYCDRQKVRRAEKQKADEFARRNFLPRYFERWEVFIEIVKDQRIAQQKASEFRRECLLAKTYYHWWRLYQEALDVQMLYRMAILSYDENTKRKFFKMWLAKAKWKLRENRLLARAQDHYETRLKMKYLLTWNEVIKSINRSATKLALAVRYQNTKLLLTCWSQWMKFTELKRAKWKQKTIADLSFQHRIMKKVLIAWKIYSDETKKIKSYAEEKKLVYDKATVGRLFQRWRKHARCLRVAKENNLISFQYWKFKTEKKVWEAWRVYAVNNFWQKQGALSEIRTAREQLDQGKLRRFFHSWRRALFLKVKSNSLIAKANDHWKKRILKKHFDIWMKYRFLGYRKLVLQQQCMWYHNLRIIASSLRTWKNNYQLRVDLTKKSHLALWMWSFTLQRKVLTVWFEYAQEKKRRKVAVNEALERRRRWLCKVGVTQWIKFATNSIAERESFATSRHIRLSQNVQQCVQRCALHWKRRTERNRPNRSKTSYAGKTLKKSKNIPIEISQNSYDIKDVKSANTETPKLTIPQASKRRKPRRPEYLRESFNPSEMSEEKSVDSRKPGDDPEALPRKWRSDFQPVPPPPLLQKPTSFTHAGEIVKPGNHKSYDRPTASPVSVSSCDSLVTSQDDASTFRGDHKVSRDNPVLLPPSCFVGRKCSEENGKRRQDRENFPPKNVVVDGAVQQFPSDEKVLDDRKRKNSSGRDGNSMPSFFLDKDNQRSIVELKNRMSKYYTITTNLRDLRRRLKFLQQCTKEPRVKELGDEELQLVHELIDKHSKDVNTLSQVLEESYSMVANDLQTFLKKLA